MSDKSTFIHCDDEEKLKRCFNGANYWRIFSEDNFIKALITKKEVFASFYDMLADQDSKTTFDWLVGYRFMAAIMGEIDIWKDLEPSPLYKMFPGTTSVDQFYEGIEQTYKTQNDLPGNTSICTLWHTFVSEQYAYKDICKADSGDVVFDVGGYIGDTALYFSRKIGGTGHIYIFECSKYMLNEIKLNISKFRLNNVSLIEKGLSEKSGTLYFKNSQTYTQPVDNSEKVDVIALDDFVADNNIGRVDFIKMDIEGGERAALLGARKTIAKLRPKMAISIYHFDYKDFYTLPELIKTLCPRYRFYLSHKNASLWETVLFCMPE